MKEEKRQNIFTLRIPEIGYEGSVSITVIVKKCRIAFDVDNTDYKDGVFGFTKLESSLIKNCKSDISSLKSEFSPTNLQIEGTDYYTSWISMRKDQTITLELDWEEASLLEDYDKIAFEEHEDFTFSLSELREADRKGKLTKRVKEIQITCKNNNPNPAYLKIKANDKVVGGLNVFYPEPKKANVRWVVVETKEQDTDFKKIKDSFKINFEMLTKYFKTAFNPALIDINLVNEEPDVIDLKHISAATQQSNKEKLKQKQNELDEYGKKTKEVQEEISKLKDSIDNKSETFANLTSQDILAIKERIKILESKLNELVLLTQDAHLEKVKAKRVVEYGNDINKLFVENTTDRIAMDEQEVARKNLLSFIKNVYLLENKHTQDPNTVYVFLTNLQCFNDLGNEMSESNNGFTLYEDCLIFCANKKLQKEKDIAHEVMHALNLEHPFLKKGEIAEPTQHYFKMSNTDNYMDYNNSYKHTWKWQWEIMHNYHLTY